MNYLFLYVDEIPTNRAKYHDAEKEYFENQSRVSSLINVSKVPRYLVLNLNYFKIMKYF